MIESATDFPFLGDRDYIHGTSILSGFIAALEGRAPGRIQIKRLKFQHAAKSNGRLLLTRGALDDTLAARANCTLAAAVDGVPWRGLFSEDGAAVARRVAVSYSIDDLSASAFGGRCRVLPTDRNDLIRIIVEANKRFHEGTLKETEPVAVRFGYLEDWAVPAADASFSAMVLEAKNLIARKTEEGHLTINRLTYGCGDDIANLTLCFNAQAA